MPRSTRSGIANDAGEMTLKLAPAPIGRNEISGFDPVVIRTMPRRVRLTLPAP